LPSFPTRRSSDLTRRRRAVVAADGGSTCRSEAPLTGPTLFLARAGTHRTLRTTRATSPLRDLPGLSAADPDSLTFPGTETAPGNDVKRTNDQHRRFTSGAGVSYYSRWRDHSRGA